MASSSKLPLPSPSAGPSTKTKHLLYTYSLAFQSVVNIGVRGSEQIRTRVVEAGALDVVVHMLEKYLAEGHRRSKLAEVDWHASRGAEHSADTTLAPQLMEIVIDEATPRAANFAMLGGAPMPSGLQADQMVTSRATTPEATTPAEDAVAGEDTASSSGEGDRSPEMVNPSSRLRTSSKPGRAGEDGEDVEMSEDVNPRDTNPPTPDLTATPRQAARPSAPARSTERLTFRDEDVLMSLQLLAYLSKYPHVRNVFHDPAETLADHYHHDDVKTPTSSHSHSHAHSADVKSPAPAAPSSTNVFSLVEAFTHRPPSSDKFAVRHPPEVQYWASVIMRNACRKDDSQGGIRQCANMACGKWEVYAREFAKCRRCRKAKFCSKQCQSHSWQSGHRYWCAKASPREGGGSGDGSEENDGPRAQRRAERAHAPVTGGHGHSHQGQHHHHGSDHDHVAHSHSHGHGHGHRSGRHADDDDEDDLPPPPAALVTSPSIDGAVSQPGMMQLAGHGRAGFVDNVAVAGAAGLDGLRVNDGLDENEVAREMMGGRGVFGEGGVGEL